MRSRWELWTNTTRGSRLQVLSDVGQFGFGRILNGVGEWYLNLPSSFDMGLVPLDNLIEFWRAPEGGALTLFGIGFIKEIERRTHGRRISGPDQNDILRSRIVAYEAGSAYSEKTDNYDDMMKAVIRQNLGSSSTDTTRDLSAYNLTVEVDNGLAPSGTLGFAWLNILDALNKMADASYEAGTELYYDLVPVIQADQTIGFNFRTYINQPGQDRREGTPSPVFFGEKWGNLLDGVVTENARDELNYCYIGGEGEESDRIIEEVSNDTRIDRSPWNRREGFVNYSNTSDTDILVSAGYAEITEYRPRKRFSGQLVDTPKARFGIDWGLGYRVTCDHDGEQFDALIRQVDIEVDSGNEKINVRVEVEE